MFRQNDGNRVVALRRRDNAGARFPLDVARRAFFYHMHGPPATTVYANTGGSPAVREGGLVSPPSRPPSRPGFRPLSAAHFAAASVAASERKMSRPSEEPSRSSQARSGCGIMPSTLRSREQMPAMDSREPLTFASSVSRPFAPA